MIECRVKDKEGFAMFACDQYYHCWNVCNADDCLYDGCKKYGQCKYCEFGKLVDGEYFCELEQ